VSGCIGRAGFGTRPLPMHSNPPKPSWEIDMKRKLRALLAGAILFGPAVVYGQYAINWYSIDGGGGTSTGGNYAVSGTIGQPDVGVLSGGGYALSGGFWSLLGVIQTSGAPWLSVARTGTNTVVVSWPGPDSGWKLEAVSNVPATPAAWTVLPPPYTANGTNLTYVEPVPAGDRFYRLTKP
jgi:hypothetical protein